MRGRTPSCYVLGSLPPAGLRTQTVLRIVAVVIPTIQTHI